LVENANSRYRVPTDVTGTTGMSTESLPSLVGEHPTTSTALDASTSHPSTLSASSPPSSTPATVTSSPPAASDHKKGTPLPQSPVHGNLGQNYAAPSEDPQRRMSVILSVSTGCDLLSRPVELDNYLKPLASEIEWEKIQALERECLLKNAMHNAAAARSFLSLLFLRLLYEYILSFTFFVL